MTTIDRIKGTDGKTYTIRVRNIGQNFACDATVSVGRRRVGETRDYPHGQRANAYAEAERIVERLSSC